MKTLYIITGTTQGLGNAFFHLLKNDNIIITINRHDIKYTNHNINLNIDLTNIPFNKLNDFENILSKCISKEITKIIFINNAFTIGTLSKISIMQNNEIIENFNVNLLSSLLLIKSFISKTKDLCIDKRIFNISSGAAKKPIDGWSVYCVSKAGMEMFIKNIQLEYPDFKCFNIDPGVIDTFMQAKIRNFKEGKDNEYFKDLYRMKKLKSANDVANQIISEYSN